MPPSLRHSSDVEAGISRRSRRGSWRYAWPDGETVRDDASLARIRKLAIPPAWTDVWICVDDRGHIQATGRDARGRKQYRYHDRWREMRDGSKFGSLAGFGVNLPRIRACAQADLALPGLSREKVIAAVVSLLDLTRIRIGNDEYARTNHTFGLTTMRNRHIEIRGTLIEFSFRGKSNKDHSVTVKDRRLANVIRKCRELPGYELFQYVDQEGTRRRVCSDDVNAYLRECAGDGFTAKDFRTWAGTVLAASALLEAGEFDSESAAKHAIVAAIERVAMELGNTSAVCRKAYIHPAVIDSYLNGTLPRHFRRSSKLPSSLARGLAPNERAVLRLLRATGDGAATQPASESTSPAWARYSPPQNPDAG